MNAAPLQRQGAEASKQRKRGGGELGHAEGGEERLVDGAKFGLLRLDRLDELRRQR